MKRPGPSFKHSFYQGCIPLTQLSILFNITSPHSVTQHKLKEILHDSLLWLEIGVKKKNTNVKQP